MARISPQPSSDWSPEMRAVFDSFRAAAMGNVPPDEEDIRPDGGIVFGTFARHPALARAFLTFNVHVLFGSSLEPRDSELVILRVAALRRCGYEWAQHALRAVDTGFTADDLARIIEGPAAPGWSAPDRALLSAADELVGQATVHAGTWAALAEFLDEHQLMDLVFTVGTYDLVAMMFRAFEVEPDPDIASHLPDDW